MRVTLEDVEQARKVLSALLPPTPLLMNPWLSNLYGCEVYLKLEIMQPIGSFKIRGATYKISKLSSAERARGVIAASAGNHAQGVAWGSQRLGVSPIIVMPKNAALMKVHNTRALGAEVRLEGNGYDEAYQVAQQIQAQSGRSFVHPYEDPDVIAGQGTVGLELLEQCPDVDVVIGSIGGGGLMAGVGTVLRALKPSVEVIGSQAAGAHSMIDSLRKGSAQTSLSVNTFADGIAVKRASPAMLGILKDCIDFPAEAGDPEIAGAVLTLMEKAKIVVEGSGALPLAILDQQKERLRQKKVVLLISGGNIDVNVLARIIDVGLIRSGRRIRIHLVVRDRPGSLKRMTEIISNQGANILQAIHDRNEPSTRLDEVDVNLVLETRDPEHGVDVVEALRKEFIGVNVLT
jgi:threonine dehydratase